MIRQHIKQSDSPLAPKPILFHKDGHDASHFHSIAAATLRALTLPAAHSRGATRPLGRHLGRIACLRQQHRRQIRCRRDTTYREIVHTSLGGSKVRVVLTNEFGTDPLTVTAARVALSAGGGDITPTADRELTFGGRPSIIIPPGALALSDPADLKLPTGADLAISLFIPAQAMQHISLHTFANQTSFAAPGNVATAVTLTDPAKIINWPFLKGINVLAGGNSAAIVAFGDSITDGAHSTLSANTRWPDVLAHRLQADKKTSRSRRPERRHRRQPRVLHDGVAGPSALARFDRDVLAQAGVKYVVILESINDIGHATRLDSRSDIVSADDLIQGLAQMVQSALISTASKSTAQPSPRIRVQAMPAPAGGSDASSHQPTGSKPPTS